jgi:hypothetical protein
VTLETRPPDEGGAARLHAACVPIAALGPARRTEMRALLARHFEGVREEDFDADLAEKDQAVVVWDGTGRLKAFSTMKIYRSTAAGGPARVLFSGDTIVDHEAWRSPITMRTWLRTVLTLAAETPDERLDWFLLASGHRTYRLIATLFRAFHPSPGGPDPVLAGRLDAFARERFGGAYDPASGIVRLPRSVHRLRPGVGDVTEARLRNPLVALFAERNPGHANGDELACLCEISEANLTAVSRRALGCR